MQIRRYGVLFLAVFAAACLLSGCSSGSSDKEQAGKPTPEQMKRCVEEGKDCPVQTDAKKPLCTIAPGSSRTFTLTATLPFIHSTDSTSSLNVEYGLAQNDWEGGGVEARLTGSSISQETGNVWTQRIAGTDMRRLLTPEGYPANTIGFKDRLLETGEPQKYMEQGKMSWEEVSKVWKIEERREKITEADKKKGWKIDESGFETRPYAFYLATITFTVSVPGEDKLEALNKNSRFDSTSLIFRPKQVLFDDGSKTHDLSPKEKGHSVPVSLHLSRKQGGGYNGVAVGIVRTGAELTRDLSCE